MQHLREAVQQGSERRQLLRRLQGTSGTSTADSEGATAV